MRIQKQADQFTSPAPGVSKVSYNQQAILELAEPGENRFCSDAGGDMDSPEGWVVAINVDTLQDAEEAMLDAPSASSPSDLVGFFLVRDHGQGEVVTQFNSFQELYSEYDRINAAAGY